MEKKINLLGVFALLTLLTAGTANAIPTDFPEIFDWESDYMQYNDPGDGGGEYGSICHLEVHIEGGLTGGFCSGFPTLYGWTPSVMYLSTTCDDENIYAGPTWGGNGDAPYIMFFMDNDDYSNENGIMGVDTDSDKGLQLTCSNENKTCSISDPAPAIRWCINDTAYNGASEDDKKLKIIMSTFWVGKLAPTADISSASALWNISINLPAQDIEDLTTLSADSINGTKNFTGILAFDQRGVNVRVDATYFIQEGVDYLSEDVVTGFESNVIMNVTNEPAGLNLESGEMGLWKCDDSTDYMPAYATITDYQNLKEKCCNLLESDTLCNKNPTSPDSKGNVLEYAVNSGTCLQPQAVFQYSDSTYDNVLIWGYVEMGDDSVTVKLPWNGFVNYEECHEFVDIINHSYVTGAEISAKFGDNTYKTLTLDSTQYTCISGSTKLPYTIMFEKEGYETAFIGGLLGQLGTGTYYLSSGVARNTSKIGLYNMSGYIISSNACPGEADTVLSGADISMRCYDPNTGEETKSRSVRVSDSTGFYQFLNFLPEGSKCSISINADNHQGIIRDKYAMDYTDLNWTLNMLECQDSDNTSLIETQSVRFKIFGVTGYPIQNALITLSSPNCGDTIGPYTSDGQGSRTFSNLMESCEYNYVIRKDGYLGVSGGVNHRSYIEETLNAEADNDGFVNVYVEDNLSGVSGARIELWVGGTRKTTKTKDSNGNVFEISCITGQKYTLKAFYQDKSSDPLEFTCQAEGSSEKLVLSNSQTRADEIGGEIGNLAYDTLWPIIQLILVIIAFKVLLDVLGKW